MSARSQAPLEQTELLRKRGSAADSLWYKDAIIYELHLRAFYDSNGDGVGDLPGLIQKLDYLQDLGVTCVWLLPFFPSPLKDDVYDIADYLNIHPMYGTLADFRSFLDAAHASGLIPTSQRAGHSGTRVAAVSTSPFGSRNSTSVSTSWGTAARGSLLMMTRAVPAASSVTSSR